MGVELGGGDVGVPEHLLQRAQIAAAREQVGGEGMTQGVRAHAVGQPDSVGVALDDLVEALTAEPATAAIDEDMALGSQADER
jgi:hypothetical protein